jgi:hypothetical protein
MQGNLLDKRVQRWCGEGKSLKKIGNVKSFVFFKKRLKQRDN